MTSQDISTLDLPQVYQKPSYTSLLSTLEALTLTPPIWSHSSSREQILTTQESLASQRRGDITRYLGQIIKSPLEWLSDEEREEVWEMASRRLSERCGRSAMGEVVRSWPFDLPEGHLSVGAPGTTGKGTMEIVIKEPALTGDSLGFKTWGSSYVLSRHLPTLSSTSLSSFFTDGQRPRLLELGSGTGLLGLAAATLWSTPVVLSDLPNIVSNLHANAASNETLIAERGGSVEVGALTWGGEKDGDVFGDERFSIVLVADPLYDDDHPGLLAAAVDENLQSETRARAVVMVPLRDDATARLKGEFAAKMGAKGLAVVEEEMLEGEDDWENGGAVRCWLGIFGRATR